MPELMYLPSLQLHCTTLVFLHASCGIMELRVFQGHLYVGILSYLRGFALIRTKVDNLSRDHLNSNENSMEWNEITINGFKEEQREQIGARLSGNEYPWSTAVIQDTLFLSTSALSCRGINFGNLRKTFNCQGQLWATKDGENWTIIQSEVIEQAKSLYGFRTMQSTSDGRRLYMGTATNSYVPSF